MSQGVYTVAAVRAAEEKLMATLPTGALMRRAATGLESVLVRMMTQLRGGVRGCTVVVLVGSGNNGGDALWAASGLARRGARVRAVTLADRWHEEGMRALQSAGGRAESAAQLGEDEAARVMADAELIIDGITGIGGQGSLRGQAVEFAGLATRSGGLVVAVDVPSGVDADTGHIADDRACIRADVTVTFGCLKPGLLVAPGRFAAGAVHLVDIGLAEHLLAPDCEVLDDIDLAMAIPEPSDDAYKYSRGVVCIAAGSQAFAGAAYLSVGAARSAGAGMVRFLDRTSSDRTSSLAEGMVRAYPDVVVSSTCRQDPRVTGIGVGPGLGTDEAAARIVEDALQAHVPLVIDADGVRIIARHPGALTERDHITVITPHEGEFRALGFDIGTDRLSAARNAAASLGCVVLLKGPGTVIATPGGRTFIDTRATASLGTAGSGDVLTGLLAGMLAAAQARTGGMSMDEAATIAAAAAGIHGLAGRHAARAGRPVTAVDIERSLPDAIAHVRRG